MSNYHSIGTQEPHYSAFNSTLEQGSKRSARSKWIVFGSVLAIVGLIAVGVGVGVSVAHKNSSTKSAATAGASDSSSSSSSSLSGDPSDFDKDSNLKKSFYGLAYTPAGVQLDEGCNGTLADVIKDIQLMSQLTNKIRIYGADCNQSALVLEAIQQTKVDMQVYLGNYPAADDNGTAYIRQRDAIIDALKTYGADHVAGITVGNEFILNYVTDNGNGDSNPDGTVGNAGAAILIPFIQDMRTSVAALNLNKKIPIGNSDAGSYFNNEVLQVSDYGLANVHPWFADQPIQDAAGWTADFFTSTDIAKANALSNKPPMYIAETGWPTQSSNASSANNGASDASEANLQIFLDTFVCQANQNGTGYFFFEFFDEPWKDQQFGGVEGWWGLFHSNRTLKHITIPDCPISS